MTDITAFFGKSKTAKKAKKRTAEPLKREVTKKSKIVIDDDDEDFNDEDDLDVIEIDSPTKEKKQSPKKNATPKKKVTTLKNEPLSMKKEIKKKAAPHKKETVNKKANETSKVKSEYKNKEDIKTTAHSSESKSAFDILATIPDCEFPDASELSNSKMFFANSHQSKPKLSDETFKLPEGEPNCLAGLTIVFTGVLPHLEREESEELAKKLGGRVTKSISSKTSLVVLGETPGASKIDKIKKFKTRHIDENGFLQLISSAPKDGGDSDLARKQIEKLKDEEDKANKAAQEEIKEAEEREELQKRKLEEAQSNNSSNPTASVDPYVKAADRPDSEKLWTAKHAPSKLSQICGNKGQVQKLIKWLEDWDYNKKNKFKYGGLSFPAVLISGPPGIGKTTAAHIVCKELGYDVIEKNASDVRSKKLLNSTIGDILDNEGIAGFFDRTKARNDHKICLIMDEVDGMSSGDLGGVGALSAFCRKTCIPIILICNDKSLPKMRPFDRVAADFQFRRPDANAIKSRILTICLREKIKVPPQIIDRLVEYTKSDIRQIINLLSTVSKTVPEINDSNYNTVIKGWEKNVAMKTFDIAGRYLSYGIWAPSSNVTLNQKIEYYFDDHSFVPLMIHENYMNTIPKKSNGSKLSSLELVAKAADSISEADLVDSKIHSADQLWSLMPLHAVMSSVRPSSFVNGQIVGRTNFTSFLGNLSKGNKYNRLLTDLNYHTKLRTLTDKYELRMNYLDLLAKKLADPLLENGTGGIADVIKLLDEYYLTKEDWEYILDFGIGKNSYKLDLIMKKLPTPVKSAFTRAYNNSTHPVAIYHVGTAGASKGGISADKPDFEDAVNEDNDTTENADNDDEDDVDIKKDKLIKQKAAPKKGAKRASSSKKTSAPKRAKKASSKK